jgi:hypothetical protein
VSQEFLYRTDIVAVFEKMGRKTVAQRMAATAFGNPSLIDNILYGSLEPYFRRLMPVLHT